VYFLSDLARYSAGPFFLKTGSTHPFGPFRWLRPDEVRRFLTLSAHDRRSTACPFTRSYLGLRRVLITASAPDAADPRHRRRGKIAFRRPGRYGAGPAQLRGDRQVGCANARISLHSISVSSGLTSRCRALHAAATTGSGGRRTRRPAKAMEHQTGFASSAFVAGQVNCHSKPEGA
jgi:hypothetical protein